MSESSKILIRRIDSAEDWTAPESSSYDREEHLQQVVAASPHWVPGVPEDAFSVREFQTTAVAGRIDVLIISPDGALTAVECKLESNSDNRRKVIGQLIDYVSAIREDGYDRLAQQWAARGGGELTSMLTPEAINQLRSRIDSGTIALCWVADRIDEDLRRLIEYLNEITRDQVAVTALQLTYARHGDVEILIPRTYGGEIAAAKATPTNRSENWNRNSFREAVDNLGQPSDYDFLTRLLELLDENAREPRRGKKNPLGFGKCPNGAVFFYPYGYWNAPFNLWIGDGRLKVAGGWRGFEKVKEHPGFRPLAQLLGQVETDTASAVRVGDLEVTADEFWAVAVETAEEVHNEILAEEPG
jgi:hypothetical protein